MRVKKHSDNKPSTFQLAKLGNIRIGEKKTSQYGSQYPTALEHFKADSENSEYVKSFVAKYGQKPKTISITFASNDINEVCPNFLELRDSAGKMVAYGDGENFKVASTPDSSGRVVYEDWTLQTILDRKATPQTFMQRLAEKTTNTAAEQAAKENKPNKFKAEWKEKLVLKFIILGLDALGYWQLTTGAKDTAIPQIVGTIDGIISQTGGRLAGVPFDLCVKKVKSDKAGAKNTYPVISLICNLGFEKLELVQNLKNNTMLLTAQNIQSQVLLQAAPPTTNDQPPKDEGDCLDYEEVE